MINLHKLEIFAQVVQAGSFSRAAQGLLMTQSAISQHIRDLETSLGAKLFERKPRGVSLTPAGETLHDYMQQIFQLLAEAENAVTDVTQLLKGRLNIGATPGVSVYLLPVWLQAYREAYPDLLVTIHTGTSSEILDDLQTGRSDLGIIEGELSSTAKYGIQILEEIEQQVVVGPNHPWWQRESIPIAELDGQRLIMRQAESQTRIWLDRKMMESKVCPVIKGEFDNIEAIKRTIAMGDCLAILPPYAVDLEIGTGTLHAISVENRPLCRTLKLAWNREMPFSPIANAFLKYFAVHMPQVALLTS